MHEALMPRLTGHAWLVYPSHWRLEGEHDTCGASTSASSTTSANMEKVDPAFVVQLVALLQASGVRDVLALSKLGANDAAFWRGFAGGAEEKAAELYGALLADEARTCRACQVRLSLPCPVPCAAA